MPTWRSAGERSPGAGETPLGRCGRGAADAMMLQGRCSLSTTVGCLAGRRASGLREEPNSQALDWFDCRRLRHPCAARLAVRPQSYHTVSGRLETCDPDTAVAVWQTPKDSPRPARRERNLRRAIIGRNRGAAIGGTRTPGVGWPAVPDRRPRREPREDRSAEWRGRERD